VNGVFVMIIEKLCAEELKKFEKNVKFKKIEVFFITSF